MSELKDRLRSDLTTAIRGRDELSTATLRMALAAITELVTAAIAETGATGMPQMGAVMRVAQAKAAGRADGKRLSTEVRRQLAG